MVTRAEFRSLDEPPLVPRIAADTGTEGELLAAQTQFYLAGAALFATMESYLQGMRDAETEGAAQRAEYYERQREAGEATQAKPNPPAPPDTGGVGIKHG